MVQCAHCGFLSRRTHDAEHERYYAEPDEEYRALGDPGPRPFYGSGGGSAYEARPSCFANAADLHDEIRQRLLALGESPNAALKAARHPSSDQVRGVIQRERECADFTRWRRGFSPKEHREMVDRQWLIDREDRRDQEMREREDERDERIEELQTKLHNRELIIVGGLVTVVIVVSTIVAAIVGGAVERGWEPGWWPL